MVGACPSHCVLFTGVCFWPVKLLFPRCEMSLVAVASMLQQSNDDSAQHSTVSSLVSHCSFPAHPYITSHPGTYMAKCSSAAVTSCCPVTKMIACCGVGGPPELLHNGFAHAVQHKHILSVISQDSGCRTEWTKLL